jgi:hypothetical protein
MNRQQQIEHFLLAAHRLAVMRLKAEPCKAEDVKRQLARWRRDAGLSRSDAYLNEWEALLDSEVGQLERVVCAPDEHGAVLRSVSPMSILLTQKERAELLRVSRAA